MRDLKHEVITFKPFNIAAHLSLQLGSLNTIGSSQVEVEHHALASNFIYLLTYRQLVHSL